MVFYLSALFKNQLNLYKFKKSLSEIIKISWPFSISSEAFLSFPVLIPSR